MWKMEGYFSIFMNLTKNPLIVAAVLTLAACSSQQERQDPPADLHIVPGPPSGAEMHIICAITRGEAFQWNDGDLIKCPNFNAPSPAPLPDHQSDGLAELVSQLPQSESSPSADGQNLSHSDDNQTVRAIIYPRDRTEDLRENNATKPIIDSPADRTDRYFEHPLGSKNT